MSPYSLTAAAAADLRGIISYTRKQWGTAQSRSYTAQLKQGMKRLALRQGVVKDMGETYQTLRMVHCEHHYIFCISGRGDAPALIIAILHDRMDVMTRLASRLKR
ncbi:MAG: type II toxin-antitoxin system RelE/ParE family toxin [Acidobacteriaceae bacterium]|nr:type II toxin-antitoxin system RelE/ParE family toxin [Acidobacteriaceae bacterium]